MLANSRAKWTALAGYAFAAAGIILYTQLDRILNLMGESVLNSAVFGSMAATFGGFIAATVGSVIWARRTPTHAPLKIAISVGVGSLFLLMMVDVNVHGPSGILMFLFPFSVINVLSLLIATRWQSL